MKENFKNIFQNLVVKPLFKSLYKGSVKFVMKKRFKRIARFCIRSLKYNDVRST